MNVEPLVLEGEYVRLEPLSVEGHLADLQEAGSDPTIFRWSVDQIETPEDMAEYVEEALAAQEAGTALPFAIVHRESGKAVGSIRFGEIAPEHRRVEIGWAWVTPAHQRTPANTEANYLMLRYAFEEWDCLRVEYDTASRNRKARAALERIGATQEGIHRQRMITHQGLRDSVFYSVLDTEWPAVKRDLEAKLEWSIND